MSAELAQNEIERMALPEQRIILTIPGRPEYITLCRLALAALAAKGRLSEETMADLKLAVTEACSYVLRLLPEAADNGAAPVIRIEYRIREDRWEVEVSGEGALLPPLEDVDDARTELGLGLTIIRALVDGLEVEPEAGEPQVLRLIKHLQ